MISGEIYCGRTDNGRLVKFKAKDSNIIEVLLMLKLIITKAHLLGETLSMAKHLNCLK